MILEQEVKVLKVAGIAKEDLVIIEFPSEVGFIDTMFDLSDEQTLCITNELKVTRDPEGSKGKSNPVNVMRTHLLSEKVTRKLL